MRAVYLIGEPGTGKTTLMNELLAPFTRADAVTLAGTLKAEPLLRHERHIGYHLGLTRPPYGGTDALAMNVHPTAVTWALHSPMPAWVFGEGQRLATAAFLSALARRGDVTLIHLTNPVTAAERRELRGSTQADTFVKGARTRAQRLADSPPKGVRVLTLDCAATPAELARKVA